METAMYITEVKEVKETVYNGISVMDCPFKTLAEIVFDWMMRVDDSIQLAGDQDKDELAMELSFIYDELETAYDHLSEGGIITNSCRNEIRTILKHVMRSLMLLDDEHKN